MVFRLFVPSAWTFVLADNVISVTLLSGRRDSTWLTAHSAFHKSRDYPVQFLKPDTRRADCPRPYAHRSQTTLLGLSGLPLSLPRTLKAVISSMIPNATA
jgi:hypothetical protein